VSDEVRHHRWDDIEAEAMKGAITRKMIASDKTMIAQVFLKKGDVVPTHAHHNEQFTYIVSGALHFVLGEPDQAREVTVREGEVLIIPSNVPHSAVALEDTFDLDVFNPPREDWLNKTDDYLRKDA
jgi:quercetin dioxygenase-like cupin family protein